ncbi:hypothetical protein OnM2_046033 [Erysiphe neolycopersici]|uniref:Uncharacterized protein n=1 Tax=Erysiphe neolycopersici TaxID=212602 RepID=A0A420HU33_9PEZI|nr:hypothetical protein OnM2_046033 [Erysiphe neolycopersici]
MTIELSVCLPSTSTSSSPFPSPIPCSSIPSAQNSRSMQPQLQYPATRGYRSPEIHAGKNRISSMGKAAADAIDGCPPHSSSSQESSYNCEYVVDVLVMSHFDTFLLLICGFYASVQHGFTGLYMSILPESVENRLPMLVTDRKE